MLEETSLTREPRSVQDLAGFRSVNPGRLDPGYSGGLEPDLVVLRSAPHKTSVRQWIFFRIQPDGGQRASKYRAGSV